MMYQPLKPEIPAEPIWSLDVNTKSGVLVSDHIGHCQAYTHTPVVMDYDNQVVASGRRPLQEFHGEKHFGHPIDEGSNYETQPTTESSELSQTLQLG
jgi:hypothetical protein